MQTSRARLFAEAVAFSILEEELDDGADMAKLTEKRKQDEDDKGATDSAQTNSTSTDKSGRLRGLCQCWVNEYCLCLDEMLAVPRRLKFCRTGSQQEGEKRDK